MVTRRWGVPALLTTLTRRPGNGEDGVAFILVVARAESNHRHADFQPGLGGSRDLLINYLHRLPAPFPGPPRDGARTARAF